MKKIFLALILVLILAPIALAQTAYWDHSETSSVVGYKISWGTSAGSYPSSQVIMKSDCVAGENPDAGAYDCKMVLSGTFTEGTTYYFVGQAYNYDTSGAIQYSDYTAPPFAYIPRAGGTTGAKPSSMQGLGVFK
jgi:hypothetical protein